VVGRLGGDEFAVLMWHLNEGQAAAKARELELAVAETTAMHGTERISAGASAGMVPLKGDDAPARVLDAADQAMYARKKERRR
jgi:diguanylate cyclase (GGDEF)-like protein